VLVYRVYNLKNGKNYIGSSINSLNLRKTQHLSKSKSGSNHLFHKALRKYSEKDFKWIIIEKCETEEEIRDLEFHYIKQYNSKVPNGYNLTDGIDNTTTGYKFKKEQRKKCIKFGKDNPNYGNKWTEEQKKNACMRDFSYLEGDNNPSKRDYVRNKIRRTKIGIKNPKAKIWVLTSPDGEQYKIEGGIKRNLKKFGFTYPMFYYKNWKHDGWTLQKVGEKCMK